MDHFDKKQNIHRLLAEAMRLTEAGKIHDASRYLEEYGKAEKRRIDEKVLYMKADESYPYSLLGEVEDLQTLARGMFDKIEVDCQRHKELWEQRKREEQEREREQIEQGALF
jgi:hypothetical protein